MKAKVKSMRKQYSYLVPTFFVILIHMVFPNKAYAYLVPGTSNYVFQLIIATLLGGVFALKVFWNNIKVFFKNLLLKRKK